VDATHGSDATPAEACELVLQRIFGASLNLSRSLRSPDLSESLVRRTIADLDESIRILRPVVAELMDAAETAAAGVPGQPAR
jgi:hypothetical protein